MVDDKPIMDQVHEYENIVADVLAEGMKMCEVLQANVLIEKIPDSWGSYCNHLKHKKKDMTLEELVGHMKIEEANRLEEKPFSNPTDSVKANVVETAGGSKFRFTKGGKGRSFPKAPTKPNQENQANLTKEDLVSVISEAKWWT